MITGGVRRFFYAPLPVSYCGEPMEAPKRHLTISDVARECGVRIHNVKYAAQEYAIAPAERVGIIRLWTPEQLPLFRAAFDQIGTIRKGVAHA